MGEQRLPGFRHSWEREKGPTLEIEAIRGTEDLAGFRTNGHGFEFDDRYTAIARERNGALTLMSRTDASKKGLLRVEFRPDPSDATHYFYRVYNGRTKPDGELKITGYITRFGERLEGSFSRLD